MTLVLLDTCSYLRFAKRIRPMLGIKFGQKEYEITILPEIEKEVLRSSRLKHNFPWFISDKEIANERLSRQLKFSKEEKQALDNATSVIYNWVLMNAKNYKTPPSPTDCKVLALGQIRNAIVVTDDLSMHTLANEFQIPILHGYELLKKMLTAKLVDKELVKEIYSALDENSDLPRTWVENRDKTFGRLFK